MQAWHRLPDRPATLTVLGRYLIDATLVEGHWRIARFAEVVDWGEERAADPAWFDGNAELPKGARGTADPSYRGHLPLPGGERRLASEARGG